MLWKKYVVNLTCSDCDKLGQPLKYRAQKTIERLGEWVCKGCSTARRNKENAKPIGSTRVHKQSGYIEEKSESGEWRRQHMLIMERNIGRRMLKDENVHHKNGEKTDNRLENLELMTFSEHTAEHNRGKIFSKERKENIREGIRKARNWKTSKQVYQRIRDDYATGKYTQQVLADKYGVSKTAIHRAIHRKAWE